MTHKPEDGIIRTKGVVAASPEKLLGPIALLDPPRRWAVRVSGLDPVPAPTGLVTGPSRFDTMPSWA